MHELTIWRIYCVTNRLNQKKYIGQTVHSLEKRWYGHVHTALGSQATCYSKLHNAIRKHGKEAFEVTLLETCDSQEMANQREIALIAESNLTDNEHGYNTAVGGHYVMLGRKHTEETKALIRSKTRGVKLSEDLRKKISEGQMGRVLSPETRAKISAANRGKVRTEEMRRRNSESRKGKKPSPETIEKVRAALTGRPRPEEVRRKISEGNRGKEGSKGEDNGSSKLTEDQVREIKRLFANGARNIDVMKQFGMSKGAIANIKSGRSWSHVILNERDA